jgi:hypothetical protein
MFTLFVTRIIAVGLDPIHNVFEMWENYYKCALLPPWHLRSRFSLKTLPAWFNVFAATILTDEPVYHDYYSIWFNLTAV